MIYLDWNAGAPLCDAAAATMRAGDTGMQGNPSSIHGMGRQARARIEAARQQIQRAIPLAGEAVRPDSRAMVFTSGGTEANATVGQLINPASILLYDPTGHPSLCALAERLPVGQAYAVDIHPKDHAAAGRIDVESLGLRMQQLGGRGFVMVSAANSETGILQPLAAIRRVAHAHGFLVIADIAQLVGRVDARDPQGIWHDAGGIAADAVTFSAAKIGGLAGVGAVRWRADANLLEWGYRPLLLGGAQEFQLRAGSENKLGIVAFAAAMQTIDARLRNAEAALATRYAMQGEFQQALLAAQPDAQIVGGETADRLWNTTAVMLPGRSSQAMIVRCDLAGIAVGAGSACSVGSLKPSAALLAMGYSTEDAQTVLRISTGWDTPQTDLEAFLEVWKRF